LSCTPLPRGARWFPEPVLIAEVLSPSTTAHDFKTKLPDYQRMASVREVMLVASEERRVEIWRRTGATWRHEIVTDEESVSVETISGSIALTEVYANLTLWPSDIYARGKWQRTVWPGGRTWGSGRSTRQRS
jgi:Uma2 family endonuclease